MWISTASCRSRVPEMRWSATSAVLLLSILWFTAPAMAIDRPGDRFHVRASDMPAPFATESVANSSRTVARPDGRRPVAPAGFRVTLFAQDLHHPRNLVVTDDGLVLLAESRGDHITWLRDRDGDGRADLKGVFVSGFDRPHGLALKDRWLYFADREAVWRVRISKDDKADGRPERLTRSGALGAATGHWTRNIAFSKDNSILFAAIGSRGNIDEEPLPRASIQAFPVGSDGTLGARRTWATGLRNPVGTAIHPDTGRLYTVVNERDGLGDHLVPDYFTSVQDGGFYGWPYSYIGAHPQPGFAKRRPDLVRRAIVPDVLFQSHSAPIGMVFLGGANVPDEWRDDALVALRGSWNSAHPTGYKVVRVPFDKGAPLGGYVNFLTGFRLDDPARTVGKPATVWGRPTGVAVMPDGAILVSDDTGRTIWHVSRR